MPVSDLAAPTLVATSVSSVTAWLVARATARSQIAIAEIGAAGERAKLAHARDEFWANRRDMARADFLDLDATMAYVARADAPTDFRVEAARHAHRLLLSVAMILGGGAIGVDRLEELLRALQGADLGRCADLWPDVRAQILLSER